MAISNLLGLAFILSFLGLIVFLTIRDRKRSDVSLREIPAYKKLERAIELAVEAGSRVHISIGHGNLTSTDSSSSFAGLNIIEHLSRTASNSDNPPVATTGNAVLAILARDMLNGRYRDIDINNQFDSAAGQLIGLTPFSYAAGTMSFIHDEKASATDCRNPHQWILHLVRLLCGRRDPVRYWRRSFVHQLALCNPLHGDHHGQLLLARHAVEDPAGSGEEGAVAQAVWSADGGIRIQ